MMENIFNVAAYCPRATEILGPALRCPVCSPMNFVGGRKARPINCQECGMLIGVRKARRGGRAVQKTPSPMRGLISPFATGIALLLLPVAVACFGAIALSSALAKPPAGPAVGRHASVCAGCNPTSWQ